jgi:hypothetical protein
MGRLPPRIENPVPETEAEVIVTAAVPFEVTVTDFVTAVPTATLANGSEVALKLSVAVAGLSCSEVTFEVLPVAAVSVTACALPTDATLAVNAALVAVAGTVTEPGTVTALLLLARLTITPPAGAMPDKLTVHESARDPVIEVLLHETALTVGATATPAPFRFTMAVGALLVIVTMPV